MRQKLSLEGAFVQGDDGLPFRYLPFDVPGGARRLEVSYHFARPEGEDRAETVDIGIFDQRGADFLAGGFRGWSGGARRGFFISPQEATPGYVRGPLAPGQWQLILACPLKRSERIRYWVDLSIDIDADAAEQDDPPLFEPATARRNGPPRDGPGRWLRGDFHSHTVHSDGLNSIDEYVAEAGRRGLDFLAITDHNTSSHFEEIARRPGGERTLLIPGEEVTTAWGHANVWGVGCWVDFRCTDDGGMQRVLDFVHDRGGLFSPNHPKASAGYPWEYVDVRGFRVTETWQGPWRFHNTESLEFWEERLRRGERIVAVGGSDCHSILPATRIHPWTLGDPCTWVYAQGPDEESILAAVRAGHVFISQDPSGPFAELTATCNDRTYLLGDRIEAAPGATVRFRLHYRGPSEHKLRLIRNGELWQQTVAEREETTLEFEATLEQPGYVRAEVAGFRGRPERGEVVHVLTNPIYLAPQES